MQLQKCRIQYSKEQRSVVQATNFNSTQIEMHARQSHYPQASEQSWMRQTVGESMKLNFHMTESFGAMKKFAA